MCSPQLSRRGSAPVSCRERVCVAPAESQRWIKQVNAEAHIVLLIMQPWNSLAGHWAFFPAGQWCWPRHCSQQHLNLRPWPAVPSVLPLVEWTTGVSGASPVYASCWEETKKKLRRIFFKMVEKKQVWFCGVKNLFIYTETCRYLNMVKQKNPHWHLWKPKIKVTSNNSSSNTPDTPQDGGQVTWAPADGKDSPSSLILSAVMLWKSILRHV